MGKVNPNKEKMAHVAVWGASFGYMSCGAVVSFMDQVGVWYVGAWLVGAMLSFIMTLSHIQEKPNDVAQAPK